MLNLILQISASGVFFATILYLSYALSNLWMSKEAVSLRILGTSVIASWVLALSFATLMTLGTFTPWAALGLSTLLLAASLRFITSPRKVIHDIKRDLADIYANLFLRDHDLTWRIATLCFIFFGTFLTFRSLCIPILGWDSLTYHSLKAGLWVQDGVWRSFDAPGGWEYYRSFFGGGEVFTAWAMLFFHSDFLSGMPDLFFWALFSLGVFCLARQCDMSSRHAAFISLAVATSLEFSRMVGSGYVDTSANALLLIGFCFFTRFLRSDQMPCLLTAAAAFGLAASTKLNMLSMLVLVSPVLLLCLHGTISKNFPTVCAAALLFLAPVIPWFIFNYFDTGYPLGCTPLKLGPLTLGKAPPNLLWLLDNPGLKQAEHRLPFELRAFQESISTYGLSLGLTVIGIPSLFLAIWKRSRIHLLGMAFIAATIILYWSHSFSVIRLGWSFVNGRFLVPLIVWPMAMGLADPMRNRVVARSVELISLACIVTSLYTYYTTFILNSSLLEAFFLTASVCLLVALRRMCATVLRTPFITSPAGLSVMALAALFGLVGCNCFKNHFRGRAYAECCTLHKMPLYWTQALRELNPSKDSADIVAFTYGAVKICHSACLYPFLGPTLNNKLIYVSPEKDGRFLPYSADYGTMTRPDFDQWYKSLRKEGAGYLLCLGDRDPPTELKWAESKPTLFTRLAGSVEQKWGFFKLVEPSEHASSAP